MLPKTYRVMLNVVKHLIKSLAESPEKSLTSAPSALQPKLTPRAST